MMDMDGVHTILRWLKATTQGCKQEHFGIP